MRCPPHARAAALFATLFAALALAAATLAGCDSDDDHRLPPPEDRLAVRSFEVDFDVREADRAGAVASVAFEAPELTPEVVDRGVVMSYARARTAFDETVWRALPYTYGVEFDESDSTEAAVDYTVTLGFAYEVGLFEASYELSADDPFVWDRLAERAPRRIRVVAFSEEAVRRNASLDLDDYEAVERRFDLNP